MGVQSWGMLGNDYYGDCGIAGDAHTCMAAAWLGGELPVGSLTNPGLPTYNQATTTYFTYEGSPQPSNFQWSEDNGYDNGVDLGQYLLWRTKNKMGPLAEIGGFAQIDDFGEMYEGAFAVFGAVYVGIMVNSEMMADVQNTPWTAWTSTATDWEGGHCVVHVYRDPTWGKAVTWGGLINFSWENWRAIREEAYVIFTPAQMAAPGGIWKGPGGVAINVAKLKSDITALGGTN